LRRLQQTFVVDDNAHRWFRCLRSYLFGGTSYVRSPPVGCAACRWDPFWAATVHAADHRPHTTDWRTRHDMKSACFRHPSQTEIRCQLDEVEQTSVKLIKTDDMWCAKFRRQHIKPASTVSVDDADLGMRTHVRGTVSWYFAVLQQLRQIRQPMPATTFQTLVVAYTILHGFAPSYMGPLVHVSDLLIRRCLRSASTDRLCRAVIQTVHHWQ